MDQPDDWGLDLAEVIEAVKKHDTGRWRWEKIHACFTGKHADLDPWGMQGIQILSCNEDGVTIVAHGGKTFAGLDVCLNLPPEMDGDDEAYYKCREAFLELATEVICGTASEGEWDGESWFMTMHEEATVPWVYGEDGVTPDYEKTAQACIDKAQELIEPWEKEMADADKYMSQIAGWRDAEGNLCEVGKPACAAWMPWQED